MLYKQTNSVAKHITRMFLRESFLLVSLFFVSVFCGKHHPPTFEFVSTILAGSYNQFEITGVAFPMLWNLELACSNGYTFTESFESNRVGTFYMATIQDGMDVSCNCTVTPQSPEYDTITVTGIEVNQRIPLPFGKNGKVVQLIESTIATEARLLTLGGRLTA